jgi:hypothetical protein
MHNICRLKKTVLTTAVLLGLGLPSAQAFELETENPDLSIRFDNTVKINYAQRVESADPTLAAAWNNNDGNRNFKNGSAVAQRLDLFTELDLIYKGMMGFRISTNSWYDHAYRNINSDNPFTNQLNAGQPDASHLSHYANRYYNGPSAEILDAFVFVNTEIGDSLLSAKLGSTTSYWGESLFQFVHGVSFGQSGVDITKALAVPGTEAKELFIPREQLQFTLNLNYEWTLSAQYFFGWDAARLPESGTYLGFNDGIQSGGNELSLIAQANPLAGATGITPVAVIANNGAALVADFGAGPAPSMIRLVNGETHTPDDKGDFGLMAQWSPEWLDGTLGFYFRNTSDLLPNLLLKPQPSQTPVACMDIAAGTCELLAANNMVPATLPIGATLSGVAGSYHQFYVDDIEIYGLSLSKNIAGISVGMDLNYRNNMPLQSVPATLNAAAPAGTPGVISSFNGNDAVAKGSTVHAVLNGLTTFADTALFDSASLAIELSYSRWQNLDSNEQLFKGSDWYKGIDKVSKDNLVLNLNFTPTFFQVRPGMDLFLPFTYNAGLSGHSAVQSGGNQGAGSFSVGVGADFYQKYRFDMKYVDSFGSFDTCSTGTDGAAPGTGNYGCVPGQPTAFAGLPAQLQDRGMLTLTFKTTF